jgi:hypothetical protein
MHSTVTAGFAYSRPIAERAGLGSTWQSMETASAKLRQSSSRFPFIADPLEQPENGLHLVASYLSGDGCGLPIRAGEASGRFTSRVRHRAVSRRLAGGNRDECCGPRIPIGLAQVTKMVNLIHEKLAFENR